MIANVYFQVAYIVGVAFVMYSFLYDLYLQMSYGTDSTVVTVLYNIGLNILFFTGVFHLINWILS